MYKCYNRSSRGFVLSAQEQCINSIYTHRESGRAVVALFQWCKLCASVLLLALMYHNKAHLAPTADQKINTNYINIAAGLDNSKVCERERTINIGRRNGCGQGSPCMHSIKSRDLQLPKLYRHMTVVYSRAGRDTLG